MSCMRRDKRVIVEREGEAKTHHLPGASSSHGFKRIQADNASINVFLEYARALTKDKKFKEALSVISLCSQMASLSTEAIQEFGAELIDFYSVHIGKGSFNTDPWSCCICATVLVDAITLGSCGHSVCKKCVLRDLSSACKKCGTAYEPFNTDPMDEESNIKLSILVCELTDKYWEKEKQAVQLRNEGNKLFQRGDVEASLVKYSEAYQLSKEDHLITSNRSHAFFKAGKLEDALEDAERTIALKPDWGKGYFRKGMALASLGNMEEALIAYFQCLVLEESCSKALRTEIYKVLYKLVMASKESSVESEVDPTGNNGSSPIPSRASPAGSMSSPAGSMQFLSKASSSTSLQDQAEQDTDSDSDKEGEGSTITIRKLKSNKKMLISKNQRLCGVLDKIDTVIVEGTKMTHTQKDRDIDPEAVKAEDFDCSLCFRLLWQPITTPCGHTYCRACIDRSLDHKRECPLCKASLQAHNSTKMCVNEFLERSIRRLLPNEFAERKKTFEDEMSDIAGGSNMEDGRVTIPIFVCTMSFPNIPCPLHVFEPRYRLMIRRAMEAGTREFGMCTNSPDKAFSDYGTMLEIRDIQYFPDGRSVVDTMGGRRFKVVDRGTKDGYSTATVEFLKDNLPEESDLEALQSLHDQTQATALSWFNNHNQQMKEGILSHYGAMPAVEKNYWRLPSGPAWAWWVLAILPLDTQAQQQVLSQVQLKKRLEAISRILGFIMRRSSNV